MCYEKEVAYFAHSATSGALATKYPYAFMRAITII